MNLYKLTNIIVDIAKGEPNVNTSYAGDIYEINEHPDIKYSVVCITQGTHRCDDAYRYYNYTIFYVDRQVSDESNKLDVQSIGIEVLDDILSKLEDNFQVIIGDHQYQTFTESFADLCAGVYITVTLQVPLTCNFDTPVVINPTMGTATFRANGDYYPQNYGWYGFDRVVVDVVAEECEETIRELQAQVSKLQNDIADMPDLNVTANGTYAHPEDKVGFKSVTVNVPPTEYVTSSITITDNGSYTVPQGVDGYSSVTVNVVARECEEEVARLQAVIDGLNAEIEALQTEIGNLNDEIDDLNAEIDTLKGLISGGTDLVVTLNDGTVESYTIPDGIITSAITHSIFGLTKPSKITSIKIGGNITEIGQSAFAIGYTNVTNLEIGNKVTKIDNYAFGSFKITSLTIPNSVETIGKCAFTDCHQLSNIVLGTNLSYIGGDVFDDVSTIYAYCNSAPVLEGTSFASSLKNNGTIHCKNGVDYGTWENYFNNPAFGYNWTFIYDL